MQRFVTFHHLKSPQELRPEAVKEYLEFLAGERQVAVSTQNQVLNALVFLYEQVLGAVEHERTWISPNTRSWYGMAKDRRTG
jgi:hypothetical protein